MLGSASNIIVSRQCCAKQIACGRMTPYSLRRRLCSQSMPAGLKGGQYKARMLFQRKTCYSESTVIPRAARSQTQKAFLMAGPHRNTKVQTQAPSYHLQILWSSPGNTTPGSFSLTTNNPHKSPACLAVPLASFHLHAGNPSPARTPPQHHALPSTSPGLQPPRIQIPTPVPPPSPHDLAPQAISPLFQRTVVNAAPLANTSPPSRGSLAPAASAHWDETSEALDPLKMG